MEFSLEKVLSEIQPLSQATMREVQEQLDKKLKPPGSLGKLEGLAVRMAGIYGLPFPELSKKAIVMMAADNGVYEEGFNSYPQETSRDLAELAGSGLIAVSVLARHAGACLLVVDVGLKGEVKGSHIVKRKVRAGTANMTKGPAMSGEEALKALAAGFAVTGELVKEGTQVLGMGEVGICNTTTSAAVLAALTGKEPIEVVGGGTGGDTQAYRLKLKAVETALSINKPNPADPLDVLAKVGGLEIAAMTGSCLAAAYYRKPIVIDGFIAGVAALAAARMHPLVKEYLLPSHLSAEKGAGAVLEALQMEPLLLMEMRLGEGTGAALAFNLLDAAVKIYQEMGSFVDICYDKIR